MFCINCGAENLESAKYCSSCGAALHQTNEHSESDEKSNLLLAKTDIQPSFDDDTNDYYKVAIGEKNTDFYLIRFDRFYSGGSLVSWNWPAFFVSFYWLLYRKMWVWALVYFLASFAILSVDGIINSNLTQAAPFGGFIYLVVLYIIFPMYANYAYYRHIKNIMHDAMVHEADKGGVLNLVSKKGGTSNAAYILALIIQIIVVFGVLGAIAIPSYQDYTAKSIVSEGLNLASKYRIKVEDYTVKHQQWPKSNNDIELRWDKSSNYIKSVSVQEGGVIIVTYASNPKIDNKSIALIPSINDEGYIVWECRGIDITSRYLPSSCQK